MLGQRFIVCGAAITVCAAAAAPVQAAAKRSYRLKNAHAKCRRGYVRQVRSVNRREHHKTVHVREFWCVYKAPKANRKPKPPGTTPPTAPPTPTPPALVSTSTSVTANFDSNETETWLDVTGSIYYGSGTQLVGQPITYTISDATTGQVIGTFAGTSNAFAVCTVVMSLNSADTAQTFTGEAVPPYAGCALGSVSLPAADTPLFSGSFAGNSTYGASVSDQEAF